MIFNMNYDNGGSRDFLLLKTGRLWVTLLEIGTFTRLKTPREEFDRAKKTEMQYAKSRVLKRLRANAHTYKASPALLKEARDAV